MSRRTPSLVSATLDLETKPHHFNELTELLAKCYTTFNKKVDLHPDVYAEEFGDEEKVPQIVSCFASDHHGAIVLDEDEKIVGVTFVDTSAKDSVAALGPVASSVPGAGRMSFEAACEYAEERGFKTLVLTQIAANTRAFSLYAKAGFEAKRAAYYVGGFLPDEAAEDALSGSSRVSLMTETDVDECAALFRTAHGDKMTWNRKPDIESMLAMPFPFPCIVARDADGKLVGYCTGYFLLGHTVATSNEVFAAMFAEANRVHKEKNLPTPRMHIPMDYPRLLSWALKSKLIIYRAQAIMARGFFHHDWPENGFVVAPSISGW